MPPKPTEIPDAAVEALAAIRWGEHTGEPYRERILDTCRRHLAAALPALEGSFKERVREALERAWFAGFGATGEGYNAEYPFDGEFRDDDDLRKEAAAFADSALAALKPNGAEEGGDGVGAGPAKSVAAGRPRDAQSASPSADSVTTEREIREQLVGAGELLAHFRDERAALTERLRETGAELARIGAETNDGRTSEELRTLVQSLPTQPSSETNTNPGGENG